MELEDLYDNNFNKLNKTIRRRIDEIPNNCYVMMSYVLIKNNNKYLLEQATERSNNTLAIPGGHILAGEDSLTGLKRELKEELNLEIDNIKHLDTFIYPYNSYIFNIYLIEDIIDIDKIIYDLNEVVNINWYSKDEILNKIKENKINKGYAYILEKYI
jgi:8-oxo-dGTP pyrophosphatase MutT (NUDIX family)